jgi:hypothetical protein
MRVGKNLWNIIFVISCFLLEACSSSGGKSGEAAMNPQQRAVCKNMVTQCYMAASNKCKSNYDVIGKIEVVKNSQAQESYREYTVIYKCK